MAARSSGKAANPLFVVFLKVVRSPDGIAGAKTASAAVDSRDCVNSLDTHETPVRTRTICVPFQRRMGNSMKHLHALLLIVPVGVSLGVSISSPTQAGNTSRQEEVAQRGANVMPFDLARTTHFFDDNATGGTETVTANSPDDTEQIALIRSHLAEEAKRFARGDFSDPAAIHGKDMPGLATLAAAGNKLRVTYRSVPLGARLSYSSRDKDVITAYLGEEE